VQVACAAAGGAMSSSNAPESPPPPPPALLAAWLAQSHDLLALTDPTGRLRWCNPAFERTTGLSAPADMLGLAPAEWHQGGPRDALLAALRSGGIADADIALRASTGDALWVQPRMTRIAEDRLWTLRDTTTTHTLATRAQHLSELLDMAQEFGRLGVWERQIPSGAGRWDRHVFGFWGMDPTAGTPDHHEAFSRIHPDDQDTSYADSTRQAGRYSRHFRVLQPDGGIRRIHSQWEVKNSPQGVPERTIGIMVDDTEVYELARSRDATAAQLKLVTELADIVIWRHDFKTDRVSYNDHGFKVLGIPYKPDGLTPEEARASTHPNDVAKLAASSAHALATGVPIDVEVRHRRADGGWRYVLVRRVIERNPAGKPLGFIGVQLDVTDQVEQSRRAEGLARRLEAAAQAARIGIWTTVVGTHQTEWNSQMYELFDMVGETGPPTLGEWISRCVHPDDAERVNRITRAFLRRESRAFEVEFRTHMRDGRIRWMVLRADLDRSGSDPTRVFGIAMDVTDRHSAQDALHAANERAALIARHAGIGTWETVEGDGPALWDEQMFRLRGLAPRAVSLNREERLALVHPDDLGNLIDARPETPRGYQGTAYEFRVRWPDGQYRWLASRSAILSDAEGKAVRRVGVNWDITDQKNAELARQQALLAERESRAKSQFLARMSHELRTPLNAVLGFTQLLQLEARQRPGSDQLDKLSHIRAAGEHLLTLINDALDLSSLEAGTLKLELRPVSLALAVARALPLVEESATARRVTIRAGRLDGSALADLTRLHQVLLNLLSNAVKYNRVGGDVSIESTLADEHVRLLVRDTGRGMDAEQLAQLFEPFNRLGLDSEGIEGSGIGMTIARALVEGMGGHIGVTSEVGRGTEFEVVLPRAGSEPGTEPRTSDPREAQAIAVAAAAPPTRVRPGQVLYIEDNAVNVLLVEELMAKLPGLRLVSESTGAAGVARARSLRPDLVLIDMQLPDFDGFEVLRQLRTHPETAGIACVALSANAMPEDIARALANGFDDYWTKPIRFREFLAAMALRFPPPEGS
jgi:PAS domain S-box-containing protein